MADHEDRDVKHVIFSLHERALEALLRAQAVRRKRQMGKERRKSIGLMLPIPVTSSLEAAVWLDNMGRS
jgi:hypothetical protein